MNRELPLSYVPSAPLSEEQTPKNINTNISRTRDGKIKIKSRCKSVKAIRVTLLFLLAVTVYGFIMLDFGDINFGQAIASTWDNLRIAFGRASFNQITFDYAIRQFFITFSVGVLATILGAFIAFFCAVICSKNLVNSKQANAIKAVASLIRAIPSILWVMMFVVAVGLGLTAAVVGLTLHSAAFLIKAYSESIEEMDGGAIEALRAGGAGFWQIVFQAVIPASITYIAAWTFLRFEQNVINAFAVGAIAGGGGLGFSLRQSALQFHDLSELGAITIMIVVAVIALELVMTRVKVKLR